MNPYWKHVEAVKGYELRKRYRTVFAIRKEGKSLDFVYAAVDHITHPWRRGWTHSDWQMVYIRKPRKLIWTPSR